MFGKIPLTRSPACVLPPHSYLITEKKSAQAAQATFKSIKSLVPLFDRVLVQRFKAETKTATGIFLPTSATNSPLPEATVIAVGPGALDREGKLVPTSVKAGDRVLLPGWGGSPIKVGDEEYHLFKDSEILAKIQE
ncbi:10 kDa heat shock protein [Pleurotus pulmonarius]|nr:10 kDa heat shock protein [Pleurotus pulmonarius]KAF4586661.1 10 kDa heat shock protein [Pleurotus pulmonarius]